MTLINRLLARLFPDSLLGRAVMIVITPLILVQVISAFVFYDNHWDALSRRLAQVLAGDITAVRLLYEKFPEDDQREWVERWAQRSMNLKVFYTPDEVLAPDALAEKDPVLDRDVRQTLERRIGRPAVIDTTSNADLVIIDVQLADGVLHVRAPRKRLFSTTIYVFVMWMTGSSLLLFGVAMIFLRQQVYAVRRLAKAADAFGKGQDAPDITPEGAREVRQAAEAFNAMRERITRQIEQRTTMLSGVSHDLRTPLTRMRLELEMLARADKDLVAGLREDLDEMEGMLNGYLAFARGEGGEKPEPVNLVDLTRTLVGRFERGGAQVDFHAEQPSLFVAIRPLSFERAISNLIANALRYGTHIAVTVGRRDDGVRVVVDDDGPGIPAEQRETVFRPFYRMEPSRNVQTGGVGLGLSIARDVARAHGGDIELRDSPLGGLRAILRLPE